MQAAVALELIHAYSLVHDDMPCMDNDVLRRGKPTVHIAYGEATAMLVGDGLQALAFEVLSGIHQCGLPSQQCLEAVSALARASGPLGMVGGQAIDLAVVGATASCIDLQQLRSMHELKTGALLRASVQLGICCRQKQRLDPKVEALLNQFAAHLGLAFQVIDDVLDESASTEVLGKTAGKDKAQQKPTYVSLMGLTAAGDFAQDLHRQALECLAQAARLDPSLHREGIDHLAGLADLIVLRQH
jgi:farnesyl diphosphate synthase